MHCPVGDVVCCVIVRRMSLSPARATARPITTQSPRRTTVTAAAASTTATVTTASAGVGVSVSVGASTSGGGGEAGRPQFQRVDNRYAVQLQRETEQMLRRQTNVVTADPQLRTFSCRYASLSTLLILLNPFYVKACPHRG